MVYVKEQRMCVKLCAKLNKIDEETSRMLCEAYSNQALSKTMTYKLHNVSKAELKQMMMRG
jgi:hypothetical protein